MAQHVAERPNTQEMVVVHRVFRREYRLAPQMVGAVAAGDTERSRLVGGHLAELGTTLHHHHTGEDELVWPRLQERAALSADLVARMQEQHERVAALLHRVDDLLPRWTVSADAALRDQLVPALRAVSDALEEHLGEEEREVLPLVEQHLTAAEWDQLGERGMASTPKARLLVLLGHILEDASEQERRMFLAQAPVPARLLYRLVGRRRFEREVALLRRDLAVPRQRSGT